MSPEVPPVDEVTAEAIDVLYLVRRVAQTDDDTSARIVSKIAANPVLACSTIVHLCLAVNALAEANALYRGTTVDEVYDQAEVLLKLIGDADDHH